MNKIAITINEIQAEIGAGKLVSDVVAEYKPGASIYVLNGLVVSGEQPLTDGDRLVLIKLGEMPSEAEMASMLTARNTPGVYDVLKNATIGIAGLGGLGSHVAAALVRVGVGRIIGADFDVVEPSNINRQYYFLDQIGMQKSDALRSTLARISPLTQLDLLSSRVSANNARELFGECDVLIEAFDLSFNKIMLFETWHRQRFTRYYIGASGVSGYKDIPPIRVKKFQDNVYMVGDFSSDPALGLVASRVGIAASAQANTAIQLLLSE